MPTTLSPVPAPPKTNKLRELPELFLVWSRCEITVVIQLEFIDAVVVCTVESLKQHLFKVLWVKSGAGTMPSSPPSLEAEAGGLLEYKTSLGNSKILPQKKKNLNLHTPERCEVLLAIRVLQDTLLWSDSVSFKLMLRVCLGLRGVGLCSNDELYFIWYLCVFLMVSVLKLEECSRE